MIDYSTAGSKIKKERLKLGLTQEKLAEKCHISVSYLAHIERGSKRPSLDVAVTISNVLNINLDYLFKDKINSEDVKIQSLENQLNNCTTTQINHFLKIAQVLISNIDEI
ncbi:MAG: helix-turn-helix domain-containing protein [Oscillospiraceae bacterium]